MYDVKRILYPDGEQIRVYSHAVDIPKRMIDSDLYVDYEDFTGKHLIVLSAEHGTNKKDLGKLQLDSSGNVINIRPEPEKKSAAQAAMDAARSEKNSLSRTVNNIFYLARSNIWDWFFTLTFNDNIVDGYVYEDCADALSSWLDTIRRYCPGMKYIVVPEHHQSGRFHFHGLFAGVDGLDFVDSGHRDNKGRPIYNIINYKLGFSTATRIGDNQKATNYLCKYINKELLLIAGNKKRYWASRNLDKAEIETMLTMDKQAYRDMLQELMDTADTMKVVEGPELTTYYFERRYYK